MQYEEQVYAGFWIRTGATIIDSILLLIITAPPLLYIYGTSYLDDSKLIHGFWDFLIGWVLPAVAVIVFWVYKSATPGKMATKLKIVDAKTGRQPSSRQFVIRYLGYYVSMVPLMLGIIWVGIDRRKQGWHDKLADTVVLRSNKNEPVIFSDQELTSRETRS